MENTSQTPGMKNLGNVLKAKREELSYSLEQIAEITRITVSTLANIEDGNIKELPGLVFVRGFVRNYAKLLGVDSDWMVGELNMVYAEYDGSYEPMPQSEDIRGADEPSEKDNSYFLILGLAILLTGIVGGLLFFFYLKEEPVTATTAESDGIELVDTTAPAEEKQTESGLFNPKKEGATKDETKKEEKPPISPHPLTMELTGKKDGWVRLTIDNDKPFDFKVREGRLYEWPAKEKINVVMATGALASIHLNGEEIKIAEDQMNALFQKTLNKFSLY